ncbi:hypothetical protein [Nocardioides sp.]|uniref:hypothetical protein n=1 Tax=Nocardioides sp. TaxID=35761 RepID=UPI002CE2F6DD|nr:hypothetical protein [Nocardioides sp.]HXH81115.1 hypothetical protein [Nocardioides sp.]
MVRWVVGAATLVVAVIAHYATALSAVIGTCRVSDQAQTIPARESAQGRLCEAISHTESAFYIAVALLAVSVILAVVLAVRWWTNPRMRFVGLTACLWLPLLAFLAFAAPSDSCSDEQRSKLPEIACDREGNT